MPGGHLVYGAWHKTQNDYYTVCAQACDCRLRGETPMPRCRLSLRHTEAGLFLAIPRTYCQSARTNDHQYSRNSEQHRRSAQTVFVNRLVATVRISLLRELKLFLACCSCVYSLSI